MCFFWSSFAIPAGQTVFDSIWLKTARIEPGSFSSFACLWISWSRQPRGKSVIGRKVFRGIVCPSRFGRFALSGLGQKHSSTRSRPVYGGSIFFICVFEPEQDAGSLFCDRVFVSAHADLAWNRNFDAIVCVVPNLVSTRHNCLVLTIVQRYLPLKIGTCDAISRQKCGVCFLHARYAPFFV